MDGSLYSETSVSVNVQLQAALQVGCFVLVNHIVFGQFVQHGGHLRKQYYGCILFCGVTQRLHRVARGFVIIFVPSVLNLGLAHSFLR